MRISRISVVKWLLVLPSVAASVCLALVLATPAKAVLNANTDNFVVAYTTDATGAIPAIITTGVGNTAGGIAVSGNLDISYSWNAEGTSPTSWTALTDAVTRGTAENSNSLRYIPLPTAASGFAANSRVELTIRKNSVNSLMWGFHGWMPNMATQNTNTLLSSSTAPDDRASSNDYIAEIKSFGTFSNLTSLKFAFMDSPSSFVVSAQLPSTIKSLSFSFYWSKYNSSDIVGWDVSGVTNFSSMFNSATSFNQNISSWNVSSATDLSGMFSNTGPTSANFNQPIGSWDVSKVTNFGSMFSASSSGTTLFNQPLSSWNTSAATSLQAMFRGSSFNQDISTWDVSKVTNFAYMFARQSPSSANPAFNQTLNSWNLASAGTLDYMFSNNSVFNQSLSNWNTSNVSSFKYMFSGNTAFNQDISTWSMQRATNLSYMFENSNFNNGETYSASAAGTKPLSWTFGTSTPNSINIQYMFKGATKFNQSLDGWNLTKLDYSSNTTNPLSGVFQDATGFNNGDAQGVSGVMDWKLPIYSGTKNIINLLNNASSFNQDISSWDMWGQKDTQGAITGATRFNQPIGHFQLYNLMVSSGTAAIKFDGMSQDNYNKTISEWSYQRPHNNQYVFYLDLSSRLKQYSTCLSNAAYTKLTVTNTNKPTVSNSLAGTNPGGCVDHTVTWTQTSPYAAVSVVSPGVYQMTPSALPTAANSGTVKFMLYDRANTSDCKVDPSTGVVTYTVTGVSCTIAAYASDSDTVNLSSVTKTFTTPVPANWTITYNYNSATGGNSTATSNWVTGDSPVTLPTPTRGTYDFAGWYTESGFTNATGLTYTPSANITLYARFTSTITYDSQGGNAITPAVVNAGSTSTVTPVRAGYTFAGWYDDTNYTTLKASSGSAFTPTASITLYAKWTANTFYVTYATNGGSGLTSTSTTTGGTVSQPATTTRAGYTFAGWYRDSGLTTLISSWPYTHGATAGFNLYAGWTANTLTVTYNSNGGSSVTDGATTTGATISSAPTAPTRGGYTFAGWYSNVGLSSAVSWPYTHGQTANFTLYAKWTANTLVVTYESNGGSAVTAGSTVTAGSISSAPTAPTRSGYNFSGWYTDSGLTTAVNWPFTHGQISDFTLYAKWISRSQQPLNWNLSATSVPYQGTLSLAVTGGSGTGAVSFTRSANSTCTISGSTLTPGQGGSVCVITATKASDSNYDAESTIQQTITVTKINQSSLSWNLSSTSVPYLGSLNLATTGGSGTGAVVYSVSGASECSIVGTTLIPSDAGSTCEITATKVSDTNYNSADTTTQTITVTKISQATLSFSNANTMVYGQTLDLLAIGGSGGGSITYAVSNAGTTGCTLSGNRISVTGAGTCAVTAVRASSTNYNSSTTATMSITVSKASQTVTFTSVVPAEPLAGDTYNVTATASSGLNPVISISSGQCSVYGNVVTFTSAGNCVILAASNSNNQYLAATSVTQTVAVGQRNQTLTFASAINALTVKTYGDPAFFAEATSSEPTLAPSYSRGSATTNAACSVSSSGLVVILAVGTCEVVVNQAGDAAVAAASAIRKSIEVVPDRANAPFITSVSAGHESITAAFIAPNYVGGSSITGYQLSAVSGSTTISNSACTLAGSGNTETCTINGLTNGTSYRIKVAAITAAGLGLYSDISASRVPATNPAAVSSFTAVPDNTSIALNWQDPISLGGGTFDSYRVFYKLSSSANYPNTYITIQNPSPTNYTITGLINGESYDVKIVTVTTANTSSLMSNTAEVRETPRTVPEAPATIEVLEVAGQLVITWSTPQSDGGNAITEYRVTINGTTCTLVSALDNLCTIPVPTSGGTYPIEVMAKNDAGFGAPATATFTKAGVASSGSSGGNESSSNSQTAIQVLSLSVKSLTNSGGQVVSITGKNLAQVTTLLIDGIKAKLISVADGLIRFEAPRNADGPATLTLKSPTASAEIVDAFVYTKGVVKAKVAWVLGFVQANTTIKAADKAKLRSALQMNTGVVAVTCVGYQSYAYNTPKDAQTAIGRAKQACSYLKSINPKLSIKTVIARTNLTGTPSRKLAVQFRAIK